MTPEQQVLQQIMRAEIPDAASIARHLAIILPEALEKLGYRLVQVRSEELLIERPTSCNRHDDCRAADEKWLTKNEFPLTELWRIPINMHCRNDCCEDCFGY